MKNNFNNPEAYTRSWYVVCKSEMIKNGTVQTFPIFGKKIAVYRSSKGIVHALDAKCPHLGADLGKGKVIEDSIQCAFHHWKFDCLGKCSHAPLEPNTPIRRAKVYPTEEKW